MSELDQIIVATFLERTYVRNAHTAIHAKTGNTIYFIKKRITQLRKNRLIYRFGDGTYETTTIGKIELRQYYEN